MSSFPSLPPGVDGAQIGRIDVAILSVHIKTEASYSAKAATVSFKWWGSKEEIPLIPVDQATEYDSPIAVFPIRTSPEAFLQYLEDMGSLTLTIMRGTTVVGTVGVGMRPFVVGARARGNQELAVNGRFTVYSGEKEEIGSVRLKMDTRWTTEEGGEVTKQPVPNPVAPPVTVPPSNPVTPPQKTSLPSSRSDSSKSLTVSPQPISVVATSAVTTPQAPFSSFPSSPSSLHEKIENLLAKGRRLREAFPVGASVDASLFLPPATLNPQLALLNATDPLLRARPRVRVPDDIPHTAEVISAIRQEKLQEKFNLDQKGQISPRRRVKQIPAAPPSVPVPRNSTLSITISCPLRLTAHGVAVATAQAYPTLGLRVLHPLFSGFFVGAVIGKNCTVEGVKFEGVPATGGVVADIFLHATKDGRTKGAQLAAGRLNFSRSGNGILELRGHTGIMVGQGTLVATLAKSEFTVEIEKPKLELKLDVVDVRPRNFEAFPSGLKIGFKLGGEPPTGLVDLEMAKFSAGVDGRVWAGEPVEIRVEIWDNSEESKSPRITGLSMMSSPRHQSPHKAISDNCATCGRSSSAPCLCLTGGSALFALGSYTLDAEEGGPQKIIIECVSGWSGAVLAEVECSLVLSRNFTSPKRRNFPHLEPAPSERRAVVTLPSSGGELIDELPEPPEISQLRFSQSPQVRDAPIPEPPPSPPNTVPVLVIESLESLPFESRRSVSYQIETFENFLVANESQKIGETQKGWEDDFEGEKPPASVHPWEGGPGELSDDPSSAFERELEMHLSSLNTVLEVFDEDEIVELHRKNMNELSDKLYRMKGGSPRKADWTAKRSVGPIDYWGVVGVEEVDLPEQKINPSQVLQDIEDEEGLAHPMELAFGIPLATTEPEKELLSPKKGLLGCGDEAVAAVQALWRGENAEAITEKADAVKPLEEDCTEDIVEVEPVITLPASLPFLEIEEDPAGYSLSSPIHMAPVDDLIDAIHEREIVYSDISSSVKSDLYPQEQTEKPVMSLPDLPQNESPSIPPVPSPAKGESNIKLESFIESVVDVEKPQPLKQNRNIPTASERRELRKSLLKDSKRIAMILRGRNSSDSDN